VFVGVESNKIDTPIRENSFALWRVWVFDDDIVCVLLQSSHKEYSVRTPVREKLIIVVCTIHDQKKALEPVTLSGQPRNHAVFPVRCRCRWGGTHRDPAGDSVSLLPRHVGTSHPGKQGQTQGYGCTA
jgi:hypothetical protein